MGCGAEAACPATFVETEDWGLDDPKGQSLEVVRRIRDEIRTKVENLVGDLDR
jgi:arsenate reductase